MSGVLPGPNDLRRSLLTPSRVPDMSRADNTDQDLARTESAGPSLVTYIFPDFRAVEYFRKEFIKLNEFHNIEHSETVGYEVYLVDQWVRERKIGSCVAVYTGISTSHVKAISFTIVKKPSSLYPPRFQEYLNELVTNHATFTKIDPLQNHLLQDTTVFNGTDVPQYLLVTNISAMPHNLNVIPIPGGDMRAIENIYTMNSNLRKLNCGGRSLSLLAESVSDACEDKFRQIFRITNASVPIKFAVLELVNLVQVCLFYFDLLDVKYADGLLCQKTEDAIRNWWNIIGLPHFNLKPDLRAGALSAKTVAAIISLTVSVKIRLQLFGGCDVPKDPFDFENFMISIGQFQKQVKLDKKRKLDLPTLSRLFYYSNKLSLSDRTKNTIPAFGADGFDEYDSHLLSEPSFVSLSLPSTMPPSQASAFLNPTTSAYRRNKLLYSKEFKKLTHVVKNTVQDHIIIKEDDGDMFGEDVGVSSHKLRDKLSSKPAADLVPSNVETVDIEVFVTKCITGKRMLRLWVGVKNHTSSKHFSRLRDVSKLPRKPALGPDTHDTLSIPLNTLHPYSIDAKEFDPYRFESLRDTIALKQDCLPNSDKSGRLGRMRFAFQSKRNHSKLHSVSDWSEADMSQREFEFPLSVLDAALERMTEKPATENNTQESTSILSPQENTNKSFVRLLTRRNSSLPGSNDLDYNLNTIEMRHDGRPEFLTEKTDSSLRRSLSCSALQGTSTGSFEFVTQEKIATEYLSRISGLLRMEQLKQGNYRFTADSIKNKFSHMNMELVRLHNTFNQMNASEQDFNSGRLKVLELRMRDFADNLDRMAFRTRDLVRKVDDLEIQLSKFKVKLSSSCEDKLEDVIQRLIHLSKFKRVYGDKNERNQLVVALTGKPMVEETAEKESSFHRGLEWFTVLIYDMITIFLQFFNLDRSQVIIERIRGQYKRIDASRS